MDQQQASEIEIKVQNASFDFVKGFITGQVVLMVLIFFLLKIFLFRGEQETKLDMSRPRKKFTPKMRNSISMQHQHTINSLILHKLKYDAATRPVETCAWLNVLFAQFLSHLRNDGTFLEKLVHLVDEGILNDSSKRPSFLGPISINELSLGDEYPELKNARVKLGDHEEPMQILIDFAFDDQITFAVETQALINWPQPSIASLPITLSVSLVKFAGTIVLEFIPGQSSTGLSQSIKIPASTPSASSPSSTALPSDVAISLHIQQDFELEFSVGSLLGHRTKVKDLPKLTSMITNALRSAFVKELVFPSKKILSIPNPMNPMPMPI